MESKLARLADHLEEMVHNAETRFRQRYARERLKDVPKPVLLEAAYAIIAAENTRLNRPGPQLEHCTDSQIETAAELILILRSDQLAKNRLSRE